MASPEAESHEAKQPGTEVALYVPPGSLGQSVWAGLMRDGAMAAYFVDAQAREEERRTQLADQAVADQYADAEHQAWTMAPMTEAVIAGHNLVADLISKHRAALAEDWPGLEARRVREQSLSAQLQHAHTVPIIQVRS